MKNGLGSMNKHEIEHEESNLEHISNINLVHIFSEELTKIVNGKKASEVMTETDYQRLSKRGIISYVKRGRAMQWVVCDEYVEVLEKLGSRKTKHD
jgi:23S rRNA G2445 N2-methylase RlmL